MSDSLVSQSRMMEVLGIKQKPALKRYLDKIGVPFQISPNGNIWTVQKAFDDALTTDFENEDWELLSGPEADKYA